MLAAYRSIFPRLLLRLALGEDMGLQMAFLLVPLLEHDENC
jgi:hypothetical protein